MGLGEFTKASRSLSNLNGHSQSYVEWRVFRLGNQKGQIWMETSFIFNEKIEWTIKIKLKKRIYTPNLLSWEL